jgi:hypothetical protein
MLKKLKNWTNLKSQKKFENKNLKKFENKNLKIFKK